MSAIALDAEGYIGSVIRRASSGGKLLLYVVSLQDELDLSPLPADAPEFALMPKTTCKQCKAVKPLQMLALHIDHCSSISDLEDEESGEVVFLDEATSSSTAPGPNSDVPQSSEKHFFQQLEDASELFPYVEEILECGYTGPISVDHKEQIIRAVGLHMTAKRIPMLQQIREGLKVYNLNKVMQRKPKESHDLFVTGCDDKVDSHYILSHLAPDMSPHGSGKHKEESKILEYFQDFLLELEACNRESGGSLPYPGFPPGPSAPRNVSAAVTGPDRCHSNQCSHFHQARRGMSQQRPSSGSLCRSAINP
ncbi:hypothetical protein ABVT39_000606 [Epinephelus coioides]